MLVRYGARSLCLEPLEKRSQQSIGIPSFVPPVGIRCGNLFVPRPRARELRAAAWRLVIDPDGPAISSRAKFSTRGRVRVIPDCHTSRMS